MNKKALNEKKEMIKQELRNLLNNALVEKRGLHNEEESKRVELSMQLEEVENQLRNFENEKLESRKVKGVNVMENLEVRKEFYQGLAQGEVRMLTQKASEGDNVGFENTIPETLVEAIVKKLDEKGQIAKDVQIMNIDGNVKLFVEKEACGYAQMLDENEVVAETNIKDLDTITLGTKRIGDLVVVSKQLLMNSPIVAENMILEQLYKRVDNVLARDFVKGDGRGKNLVGLLTLKDDEKVGMTKGDDLIDDLLDMTLDMHPTLLNGCKFYMNRANFKAIAKLKDAEGKLIVVRDVVNNMPTYRMFGFEIMISDEMTDEIIFANLKEAMVVNIQKSMEMQVLKETYARANAVGILVNMQLDNAIRNKQAIRILKNA